LERVALRAHLWFYLAGSVLPTYGADLGDDLADIPIEERVVIVAILDSTGRPTGP
jgi:hypothetical protein